jgi:hypothetical protein
MKRLARVVSTSLFFAMFLISSASAWPINGLQLGNGYWPQNPVGLVSDGVGGIYAIRFPRYLPGGDGIHVHRVNGAGSNVGAWPDTGLWLANDANTFEIPSCSDDAGGLYLSWVAPISSAPFAPLSARVTRILGTGAVAPGWTLQGRTVNDPPGNFQSPLVCPDAQGGVIVAWQRSTPDPTLKALRLQADGTNYPGWPDSGLSVYSSVGIKFLQTLVADGQGNAILTWTTDNPTAVHAHRILGSGAVDPAWPVAGITATPGATGYQSSLSAVSDGAGGVFIAWLDGRDTFLEPKSTMFLSRFAVTGILASGWPAGGLRIGKSGVDGWEGFPNLIADGAGGVYLGWNGLVPPNQRAAFVQRVAADGAAPAGWSLANPIRLTDIAPSPGERGPGLALNAGGGVFAAWHDLGSDEGDVYMQSLGPDGVRTAGWPSSGLGVCVTTGVQDFVRILPDGNGAAYVAWRDARTGTQDSAEVYLQRVDADGMKGSTVDVASGMGTALRLSQAQPNPAYGRTTFTLELPKSQVVNARIVNVQGRVVRHLIAGETLGPGRHALPWDGLGDDAKRSPAGLYFLVVEAGSGALRSTSVVLLR